MYMYIHKVVYLIVYASLKPSQNKFISFIYFLEFKIKFRVSPDIFLINLRPCHEPEKKIKTLDRYILFADSHL